MRRTGTATTQPDLLDDILAVEHETATLVDAERSKAAEWLEQATKAIDQASQAEIERLKTSAAQDEAAAKVTAAKKAAEIVETSKSLASRIESIDDARLKPIVWKHVACILPKAKR